jgi:diadenosine tetraphosphate (Ap4A) HIT family hydrolase
MTSGDCPLCALDAAEALWANDQCFVISAEIAGVGTICRVVWREHIREMSALDAAARGAFMDVVFGVEAVLRTLARPAKINLASLGNLVPHLHWHVIPRYLDDAHFPDAIWAPARREAPARSLKDAVLRAALEAGLGG